jgi:hypothetical protein
MKNKILFAIILSFYSINNFAQSFDNKIKIVKEISYVVENSKIKSREELFEKNPDYITTYDRKGGIIESKIYSKNSELLLKILNERNEQGEHFKTIMFNSSNEIKSYSIIEYDLDKTVNQILTYNIDNKLSNIVISTYDKEKNLAETLIKDSINDIGWKKIYKYNDENKLTDELVYKPDGTLTEKKTYTYSGNTNKMLHYNYKSDGSFKIIVSEYDETNNIKFQKWINEKGEITHNATYEYIYDKHGNWITQKKYFSDNLFLITEKEITYWE